MPKNQLYVLAPDKSSGDAFGSVMQQNGVASHMAYVAIHPRVVGDKISTSPLVAQDLQRVVDEAVQQEYVHIAIACNTLQLWIPEVRVPSHVRLYTTFEAAHVYYPEFATRPLWLGTSALVRELTSFPTLLTRQRADLQHLVQEIIWRTKAVTHVDVQSAFPIANIASITLLTERVNLLVDELVTLGESTVILGCTELPIAVHTYCSHPQKNNIVWVDPAQLLSEYVRGRVYKPNVWQTRLREQLLGTGNFGRAGGSAV